MKAIAGALLVGILALAGGGGCAGEEAPPGTVTLTFWHSFTASTQPALQALVDAFEAGHPGIRIRAQYIPTGDALIQKLITSIQSGTAPDVSWVHADFLGRLAEARALYPMAPFLDGPDGLSAEELADIYPGLLEAATWRDTLYAMPMEATLLALLYNRDLLRQSGLDRPPQTWDELRAYARKLTVDEDGDGRTDRYGFYVPIFPASGSLNLWMVLQWTPFLWQAGGTLVDSAQTEVRFNRDAGVQALTLWRDLYEAENFRVFTGMGHDAAFASGRIALVMDGPWSLPRYRQMKDVDWGVAPLPAGPARRVTYLAGEHLAVFRQSAHPDAAWTFIKWVLRPETQAMFSAQSGYLPVRKSTLQIPSYQAHLAGDPPLRAFVEQLPLGQVRPPIDRYHVEINQHLAEALEQATVGRRDPKAALDDAAAKCNRLLQSN
jgi:ABC-type glycerol-3-phosphate transport system substrate-binding protein